MADTQQQGVMAMVKIDGDKVKRLREQKGLTQLYVATVVQVTTDTISRWENKRYPTIKKENGLRLAEALEVDLVEILMADEDEESVGPEEQSSVPADVPRNTRSFLKWLAVAGGVCLVLLAVAVSYHIFYKGSRMAITARRIMPSHCTAGQPFPVTIEVNGPVGVQLAIIVKEGLPEGMTVRTSEPPISTPGNKTRTLKWLKKIEGRALFTYIATLTRPLEKNQILNGSVATSNNDSKPVTVTGSNTIKITAFHWADADEDNTISDREILTVYDQYGDLEKLGIDVDRIEEIWLGSGYRWNADKKIYEIVP